MERTGGQDNTVSLAIELEHAFRSTVSCVYRVRGVINLRNTDIYSFSLKLMQSKIRKSLCPYSTYRLLC